MKKVTLSLFGAMLAVGMLTGCGERADENKTPEQIKSEVASWDAARIEKQIEVYKKAIEEKSKELAKVMDQIKEIPLQEQLGEKAKDLRAQADEIGKSLGKLKDNMAAYVDGLKAKNK
ncbi:MAG TPA: hypothetical protein K8W19_18405 [Victivallis vadensis]|nr:hypothetical protein [Victivallis vadensis]